MVNSFLVSSQYQFEIFPHYLKLKSLTAKIFQPFIELCQENANYQVKTADTPSELAEVLRLRFEVFYKEFAGKKGTFSLLKYDIDSFDFHCDHLIVKDKITGKIVATYRLLASNHTKEVTSFYSESEFHLSEFLNLPGNKLELGRACVDKNYRNGEVISLLWKGLCNYARKANTKYMFGCSSITQDEFIHLKSIKAELSDRKAFVNDFMVSARLEYSMPATFLTSISSENEKPRLNSLMNMYLLAGARMFPDFAYDRAMNCIDVFTVVDMDKIPASFIRRFA